MINRQLILHPVLIIHLQMIAAMILLVTMAGLIPFLLIVGVLILLLQEIHLSKTAFIGVVFILLLMVLKIAFAFLTVPNTFMNVAGFFILLLGVSYVIEKVRKQFLNKKTDKHEN